MSRRRSSPPSVINFLMSNYCGKIRARRSNSWSAARTASCFVLTTGDNPGQPHPWFAYRRPVSRLPPPRYGHAGRHQSADPIGQEVRGAREFVAIQTDPLE